eukprot:Em0019g814a
MSGKPSQAKQPANGEPLEGALVASRVAHPTSGQGSSTNSSLRKPLLVVLSVCIALAAIGYAALHLKRGPIHAYQLPSNVLEHFRRYDTDGDGIIDPNEFARLLNNGEVKSRDPVPPALVNEFIFRDLEHSFEKEAVIVIAEFKPIVLQSMMKFKQSPSADGSPETMLPGLVKWKTPSKLLQSYGTGNFKFFMPPDLNYPIGDTYTILSPLPVDAPGMHMYRYHPFQPPPREVFLFALLSQFHPYVFLQSRYGPRGSMAVVRARNNRYLDIMMRVHAEYQLNDEPNRQFWFTPAQYTGRLIIDKEAQHVEFFELYLPTNKQLNTDMEWIIPDGSHSVDIGFVPEMRLCSLHPSAVLLNNSQVNMGAGSYNFSAIKWDEEISVDRALVLLEQGFYPFKKIPYLYFTDAMDLARQQEKLVHFILLSYISSWALVMDIEDLIKNTSATEEHRKFGRLAMDAYKFPVESMVIRPTDGAVVHRVNANDLLHVNQTDHENTTLPSSKSHVKDNVKDNVDMRSLFNSMLQSMCHEYLTFLEDGKRKAL